jgi:hypothetical protein
MAPLTADGQSVQLQAVFHPLDTGELNHLWSNQSEINYRLSIAYELALAPIVPKRTRVAPPLVAELGLLSRADPAGRHEPFTAATRAPVPGRTTPRTDREDWAPHICFVHSGAVAESLTFAVGSQSLADFEPRIWIAGEVGSRVTLRWEIWDRTSGWRSAGQDVEATVETSTIDPANVREAPVAESPNPLPAAPGQAVLHASREYRRGADGVLCTVRSNALLVTQFAEAPA